MPPSSSVAWPRPSASLPTNSRRDDLEALVAQGRGTLVIERADEPVGTVRLDRHGDAVGIYGFAIVPFFQGRGIGRQVLSGLARNLSTEGVTKVSLEVSTANDAALRLYLGCGFDVMGTEDYYAVQVRCPSGP